MVDIPYPTLVKYISRELICEKNILRAFLRKWMIDIYIWESGNMTNSHSSIFRISNPLIKIHSKPKLDIISCTWVSRIQVIGVISVKILRKGISFDLVPYSVVWLSTLIWLRWLFFHSRETLMYDQDLFFINRARHIFSIFNQHLQSSSLLPERWLQSVVLFQANIIIV